MLYPMPGSDDALFTFKSRYENFIGGEWVAPSEGNYFDNITPVTGAAFCEIPRSSEADLGKALDAAHAAADAWGKTSVAERSNTLLRIADRIEANLETLAYVETWDNGKGIRETLNADIPLLADHFRYFAGCLRAQEGSASDIDGNTVSYHFHEPLGSGRANHTLELPAADGRLEAGPGTGGGQLRGAQALRSKRRSPSSS